MRDQLRRITGSVCLSLLLVILPASAQATTNRLTALDVFNLEVASDPQISPDGTRIVYVRQFADIMTDKNYSTLWMIKADGSDHRPLTTGNRTDTSPRWSPDGARLAFISEEEGKPQIYVRWMDTGQTARLTNLQHPPSGLAWSPDGKQIAFASF